MNVTEQQVLLFDMKAGQSIGSLLRSEHLRIVRDATSIPSLFREACIWGLNNQIKLSREGASVSILPGYY